MKVIQISDVDCQPSAGVLKTKYYQVFPLSGLSGTDILTVGGVYVKLKLVGCFIWAMLLPGLQPKDCYPTAYTGTTKPSI